MKFKLGFTVAELMIVIVIIGVVCVLVLPLAASKKPSKEKALIRKNFFVAERIINSMIEDQATFPQDTEARKGFAFTEEEQLTNSKSAETFCTEFSTSLRLAKARKCDASVSSFADKWKDGAISISAPTYVFPDGAEWVLTKNAICDPTYSADKDAGCKMPDGDDEKIDCSAALSGTVKPYTCMYVDVNGFSTPPNKATDSKNIDRFTIVVFYNGKVSIVEDNTRKLLKSKSLF